MRLLTDTSGFLIENGTYILCFCIVLFFLIRYSLARYTGPGRQYLDYIPPWSLYKTFNGVSFLFNMASMLSIDIPVAKALERLEKKQHSKQMATRTNKRNQEICFTWTVTCNGNEKLRL